MMRTKSCEGLLIVAILLAMVGGATAQEFRATVKGQVVDSSKASLPGATVTIRNQDTNEVATATTNTEGNYTIPFLRPGTYTLTVEMSGFQKYSRSDMRLEVSQIAVINAQLGVGGVTESVNVSAESPLLETSKADRGTVIDQARIAELPLQSRSPMALATLIAGVTYNAQAVYLRPFDNGALADWSMNGGQNRNNEFLLDGAPNNANQGGNNIAYVPPAEAVQEFKVSTNSYDAQYGRTAGGVINMSLKSGTNSFHGVGYDFMRPKGLAANSFLLNSCSAPKTDQYIDQYGFSVDGPIFKNKTFFLFTGEKYREGTPNPLFSTVPTPAMKNGDFSGLVDASGRLITIYDPATGRDVNGVWTRDPFPGNIIPKDRINPIARNILSYFPAPNVHTPGDESTANNYFFSGGDALDKDRFYNLVIKFDQQFGSKHHMFFRHGSNDRTQRAFDNSNAIIGPGARGSLPEKRINDAYALDWVGVMTPRTVANVRVSFARYLEQDRGDQNQGFDMTKLGFPTSMVSQLPGGPYFGVYAISDYQTLGQYPSGSITNTWSAAPNISRTQGLHSLKAGADLRWIQYIAT